MRYPRRVTLAARIDQGAQREPIHFSQVFTFGTPTLCGKSDVPKPASNEWCYVECPRCLALKPEVHARPTAGAVALCGLAADGGRWTTRRSAVTCDACLAEIDRRLVSETAARP